MVVRQVSLKVEKLPLYRHHVANFLVCETYRGGIKQHSLYYICKIPTWARMRFYTLPLLPLRRRMSL